MEVPEGGDQTQERRSSTLTPALPWSLDSSGESTGCAPAMDVRPPSGPSPVRSAVTVVTLISQRLT